MKRLPSGIRYGAPWPIAAFNRLAPLARVAGLFPTISDPSHLRDVERHVGRSDHSSDWIVKGREVRLKSFDEDARLSLFGAIAVRSQMRRCFRTVLELDRLIEKHPEITHEKIERPLFVIGWPRTGTTLLQRLLCLHEEARYIPVWEAYDIIPEKNGRSLSTQQRRRSAQRGMSFLSKLAPDLKTIHPMGIDDPDECFHLFRNYLAMPLGLDFAYLPSYWGWFEEQNAVPAYEMHKRQLQVLQWADPKGHWVLKSPQHLFGLPALMQVYPDANIVCTHRDPVDTIGSYCSMMTVLWGMTSDHVNVREVGAYALETAALCKRIGDAALAAIPERQVINVAYGDLTRDPIGTVEKIHGDFGYSADTGLKTRMSDWLKANPSDRHGKHRYALSDFGLTRADVERALA